jgi:hypothetical protein
MAMGPPAARAVNARIDWVAVSRKSQTCVGAADRILARPLTPALSRDFGPFISGAFRAGEGAKPWWFGLLRVAAA